MVTSKSVAFFEHPIFDVHANFLSTPAQKQLHESVTRWIWTGQTGALVYGKSRVGKTTAVLSIINHIAKRDGKKVVANYCAIHKRDVATIRYVFKQLCLSADRKVLKGDTGDDMRDRFLVYLLDQCTGYQCDTVLLVVDEMQRLTIDQLDVFAELDDILHDHFNIHPFTLFVGNNPECWRLVNAISQPGHDHIYGRFFTQGEELMGLTSQAEVKDCLKQYDHLCYPLDGPTYTQYFLPPRSPRSWKLASLSPMIWSVYSEYKKQYKIRSWGLQYFASAIRVLLSDFICQVGPSNINEDVISTCVEISGLIPSLVSKRND